MWGEKCVGRKGCWGEKFLGEKGVLADLGRRKCGVDNTGYCLQANASPIRQSVYLSEKFQL